MLVKLRILASNNHITNIGAHGRHLAYENFLTLTPSGNLIGAAS